MSKKSKKNLQKLLDKRRALNQVSQAVNPKTPVTTQKKSSLITSVTNATMPELPAIEERPALPNHHSREILRTLVSVFIITIILSAALIIDKRTDLFTTFGNWLFHSLKLKS